MPLERLYLSCPTSAFELANRLKRDLENAGFVVVSRAGLRAAGVAREIDEATRFLACFASSTDARTTAELELAVQRLKGLPETERWLIPVKLEPCEIPLFTVEDGETPTDLGVIDLTSDWRRGVAEIVAFLPAPLPSGGSSRFKVKTESVFAKNIDVSNQHRSASGQSDVEIDLGKAVADDTLKVEG